MKRTTVMLPREMHSRALRRAREEGSSLGALIREALQRRLERSTRERERDPFLADDEIFGGAAPRDLAANHDKYLYGDAR